MDGDRISTPLTESPHQMRQILQSYRGFRPSGPRLEIDLLSIFVRLRQSCILFLLIPFGVAASEDLPKLELPGVREQHVMIPMRDGVKLSAYLYLPEGESQSRGQRQALARVGSTSGLRRLLACGGLQSALRRNECAMFHNWKLVRFHGAG